MSRLFVSNLDTLAKTTGCGALFCCHHHHGLPSHVSSMHDMYPYVGHAFYALFLLINLSMWGGVA